LPYFPDLKDKKVLLVSHNLTLTGAPLLLVEAGRELVQSGAHVKLVSLGPRDALFPLSELDNLAILDLEDSFDFAAEADLIVVNTAVVKTWVDEVLRRHHDIGRRIIWWMHEIDMETYGGQMESLQRTGAAVFDSNCCLQLWQATGLTPDIVITIHPGVLNNFLNDALRLTKRSWWRKLLGADHKSERSLMRGALGVSEDDFLILAVAQYCALKGQDLLVEAVGRILEQSPDLPLKLLLVGFQDEREIENFLGRLSVHEARAVAPVRAVKRASNPKPYFLAADVFVLNTQEPGETFGVVSIEAMAFGLPVLRTDGGGTREVVIDGVTGLIHPTGEAGQKQLMSNIKTLYADRQLARAMGKAGLNRVLSDFRAERYYRELAELFSRVMQPVTALPQKSGPETVH
jgi:glycosyltransferase involved in cell wall biosynthesis